MITGWLGRAVAQGFLVGGWGVASFCSGATSVCTEREQGLRESGNALLCDAWCHCLVRNSKLTTCPGDAHLRVCSRVSRPVPEGDDHVTTWRINPFTSTQSDGAGLSAEALSFNLALQVPLGA